MRVVWFICGVAVVGIVGSACALRSRMCMTEGDCGATNVCIAGRCVQKDGSDGGGQLHQAIFDRGVIRVVASPTEVAYLRPADAPGASIPNVARLAQTEDARLFLRFNAPVPPEAIVIEAYLLLPTSNNVDSDPTAIALHASRVIDRWEARTISWANQPRVEDTRSPATFVTNAGRSTIRIDVKDLVARWALHEPNDQGLAVVADATSATGIAISLTERGGPRLEIYAKMPQSDAHLILSSPPSSASSSSQIPPGPSPLPNPSTGHPK